jgi:hypothetical protein
MRAHSARRVSEPRRVLAITLAAALAAFCIVQDRVTAAGARRYVALQKDALAGRGPMVTIDEIMRPAIDRSVRDGLLVASGVIAVGGVIAWRRRPSVGSPVANGERSTTDEPRTTDKRTTDNGPDA